MEYRTDSRQNGKMIYAVLWVDDCGSFPLSKTKAQWYEQNAGPFSLGFEIDQRFPRPFERQLEQLSKDSGPPSHYLSHHYHPLRFQAAPGIKKIYDLLRLRYLVSSSLRAIGILRSLKSRQTKRIGLNKGIVLLCAGLMLVLLIAILYIGIWHSLPFLFLLVPYAVLVSLGGLVLFIHLEGNWVHDFADWEWNRQFLMELKSSFEKRNQRYTPVIRHGLNTPPVSSMEFYMSNMQVLADASATPTPLEGYSGRGTRRLHWQVTQPYYASLSQDYNIAWDGSGEQDRGILELPVNLGNIAEHGFGEFEKQVIDKVPDGGLVSAFLHGWDNFSGIESWVHYLKENYKVNFVRADEYAKIYMKQNPRPVLINRSHIPYWALKKGNNFQIIREVDDDTISIRFLGNENGLHQILLKIDTVNPIPEILIESLRIKSLEPNLDMEATEGGTLLKRVPQGIYHLELDGATDVVESR